MSNSNNNNSLKTINQRELDVILDKHAKFMRGQKGGQRDFRGAYVAGANLTGADLASADLREGKIMNATDDGNLNNRPSNEMGENSFNTIFTGAKMAETDLSGVKAISADFSDADMTGVTMQEATLTSVSFEGANLTDADLTGSDLTEANLQDTVMRGTVLKSVEMKGAKLDSMVGTDPTIKTLAETGKNLDELLSNHSAWVGSAGKQGAQMDVSGIDLRDVPNLRAAPMTAIKAIGANFVSQDLSKAAMQSATLDQSTFRDCKMIGADLRGSSQSRLINRHHR